MNIVRKACRTIMETEIVSPQPYRVRDYLLKKPEFRTLGFISLPPFTMANNNINNNHGDGASKAKDTTRSTKKPIIINEYLTKLEHP